METQSRVEYIKSRLPLESLIQLSQPLVGQGRWLKGEQHDSLVVDVQEQQWYWNSQSESGDQISWIQYLNPDLNFSKALKTLEEIIENPEIKITVPETFKAPPKEVKPPDTNLVVEYHNKLLDSEFAQREWKKRGITKWHYDKWLLGFKENHWGYGNALSIPFIEQDEVKTIRHRILKPSGKNRYLPETEGAGSWLFNADLLYESPPYVVLLEGEIKCMVFSSFGEPCVGLTGVNILPPRYIPLLAKIKTVYVLPDPSLNSKKQVSPYDIPWVKTLHKETEVKVILLPEKVDDWLLANPNNFNYYQVARKESRRVTDECFKVRPLDKFKK